MALCNDDYPKFLANNYKLLILEAVLLESFCFGLGLFGFCCLFGGCFFWGGEREGRGGCCKRYQYRIDCCCIERGWGGGDDARESILTLLITKRLHVK